jgi:hypothetical protein
MIPSVPREKPLEEMSDRELLACIRLEEQRLPLYRRMGFAGGVVGSFALRRALLR